MLVGQRNSFGSEIDYPRRLLAEAVKRTEFPATLENIFTV